MLFTVLIRSQNSGRTGSFQGETEEAGQRRNLGMMSFNKKPQEERLEGFSGVLQKHTTGFGY